MNMKVIALVAVLVLAVPAGAYGYYVYGPHEFADVYDDCYLEVQGADTLMLKETASHNSKSMRPTAKVLGTNYEVEYGTSGNTLYKTMTADSSPEEVKMYTLDEGADTTDGGAVEDRRYQYIDRDVKSMTGLPELGEWTVIEFYGLESDTDSYQAYMNGYKYDPNAQLTYLLNNETGKMYNITELTRAIEPVNLVLMEVVDTHSELSYIAYKDGKMYITQNKYPTLPAYEISFNDDETVSIRYMFETRLVLGIPYLADSESETSLIDYINSL